MTLKDEAVPLPSAPSDSSTSPETANASGDDVIRSVLMEEYRMLRSEVHQSMDNRNQILSFGFATIGALLGIAFVARGLRSPAVGVPLFSFTIPSAGLLLLYLWLSEFARMARAGAYLARLEVKINATLRAEPGVGLTWESHRWGEKGKSERWIDAYWAISTLFGVVLPLTSTLSTQIRGYEPTEYWWAAVPWGIVVGILMALVVRRAIANMCSNLQASDG